MSVPKVCKRGHVRVNDGRDHCVTCRREREAARYREGYLPVTKPPVPRVDPAGIANRDMREEWEEWEHFAGFGWSDEQIAERLGLNVNNLRTTTRRRQQREQVSA